MMNRRVVSGFLLLTLLLWSDQTLQAQRTRSAGGGRGGRGGDKVRMSFGRKVENALKAAEKAIEEVKRTEDAARFSRVRDKLYAVESPLARFEKGIGSDDADTKKYKAQYNALWKSAYVDCESILVKGLEDAQVPKEIYTGGDKAEYSKMVLARWNEVYPDDEVLGIIFHRNEWTKTKLRRWNDAVGEWQYTDTDALGISVVVKMTDKIATIYPAFINKDNIDGKMNAGVHTKSPDYVIQEVLVANVDL